MIPESKWIWYGKPGHLCVSDECRFHLCTKVGEYLISSVGDYRPSRLRGMVEPIGGGENEYYETSVFKCTGGSACPSPKSCGCGLPAVNWASVITERSETCGECQSAHARYCAEFAATVSVADGGDTNAQ